MIPGRPFLIDLRILKTVCGSIVSKRVPELRGHLSPGPAVSWNDKDRNFARYFEALWSASSHVVTVSVLPVTT